MFARISTLHPDGGRGSMHQMREAVAAASPHVAAQEGCIGSFALGDPVGGAIHMVTFWSSAEALIASNAINKNLTREAAGSLGADPTDNVVQVLEVLSVDLEGVIALADRSGAPWPLIHRDATHTTAVPTQPGGSEQPSG